jgi:hypothetical protein
MLLTRYYYSDKSRRIKWAERITRTGKFKMHTQLCSENLKVRDHLEDLGIDVIKINCNEISVAIGLSWLRIFSSGEIL